MPIVNVKIQPEILNWVIGQIDERQLGEKLANNLKKWIDGTKTPTFRQIEEMSKKTNIPLGYFFLQTPPVEKIELLEYRTVDSANMVNPSRDLIDIINEMEGVQDWMKEYRQDTGFDSLSYVGSLKNQDDTKKMAEYIRKDLDIDIDWYRKRYDFSDAFSYIRNKLNEMGIIVMLNGVVGKNTHRALNIDEFRAFTMIDIWAPLIFINSTDSQGAKLFSLFHEIAHIWIGEDDLFNDRKYNINVKPIETICNAIAGELLVPTSEFLKKWKNIDEKDIRKKISYITKEFKCSESVLARRAYDEKKINKALYDEIIDMAIIDYNNYKENKKSKGGDYYNTVKMRLDGFFVRALCESIKMGRTTFTEAYRLTNTNSKTFFEVANRFGGNV